MSSLHWSYKLREVNSSISLLADNRSFGCLYGSDSNSQDNARLIVAAPEMYRILQEIQYWCKDNDITSDIECDIWEVLARIDGKEVEHE